MKNFMNYWKLLPTSTIEIHLPVPHTNPERRRTRNRRKLTDADKATDEGRTDDNEDPSAAEALLKLAFHNCSGLKLSFEYCNLLRIFQPSLHGESTYNSWNLDIKFYYALYEWLYGPPRFCFHQNILISVNHGMKFQKSHANI